MAGSKPEAFGELFKRHSRSVQAYCARRTGNLDLVEDLTSVVFMEAFRRRRKLQLSNASALPWLIGVAARSAGDGWSIIARALNCEKVPTAHGGEKWYPSTVRAVALEHGQ